jgi:hypothetical protein
VLVLVLVLVLVWGSELGLPIAVCLVQAIKRVR